MICYWLSTEHHTAGDIIQPGNFRRTVARLRRSAPWRWNVEQFLERRRQKNWARLPSRLGVCFVWDDAATAQKFVGLQPENGLWASATLFAVKILDTSLPMHVADVTWYDALVHQAQQKQLHHIIADGDAEDYWDGAASHNPVMERLTRSPIEVIIKEQL